MTYTTVDQVAPGRPNEIVRASGELTRLSDNLEKAEQRMTSLVDGISSGGDMLQGAAADAFAEKFRELPPSLGNVAEAARSLGSALSRWGHEVDGLRAEAKRALDRYNAQKRRRGTAQGQVDAAAARLSQLRAQVGAAESRERGHLRDHRRESWTGQQAAADASYQQYQSAFRERRRLEGQRDDAAGQKRRHEATVNSAESEMRSTQQDLQRILDRHGERDRASAEAIERALPSSLRNKGWLEKAGKFVVDQIDKLASWVEDLASTIDAMVEAALEGDWKKAVFRFRELVDQITPIVSAVLAACLIVGFILGSAVPGLNVLLWAAAGLAVARFAATGFLLATDADDPDHPGRKAASLGELFADGVMAATAIATAGMGPPTPKPGSWLPGADKVLNGPVAKSALGRTVQNVARPIANQMVKHPMLTRFTEKIIYEQAIKPRVDAKLDAVKERIDDFAYDGLERVTGIDSERIKAADRTARELQSDIAGLQGVNEYLTSGEAPKSASERFLDLKENAETARDSIADITDKFQQATGVDTQTADAGGVKDFVSGITCPVPTGGGW